MAPFPEFEAAGLYVFFMFSEAFFAMALCHLRYILSDRNLRLPVDWRRAVRVRVAPSSGSHGGAAAPIEAHIDMRQEARLSLARMRAESQAGTGGLNARLLVSRYHSAFLCNLWAVHHRLR